MFNSDLNIKLDQMRREELLRRADERRQCAEMENPQTPVYGPTLARFGKAMSQLGDRLQERYGDETPAPRTKFA